MTTSRKTAGSAPAKEPATAKPPRKAAAGKHKHEARQKLVRDSFTIPKSEVATLDALKLRAATLARPSKKSEILRAGIAALHAMSDKDLLAALARIPSLKTGRPSAQERPEE